MYVYEEFEKGVFTVGFYKGTRFVFESGYNDRDEAADRVHYLNGGKERIYILDDDEEEAFIEFAKCAMLGLIITNPTFTAERIASMAHVQAEAILKLL